jgi:hypothetical protein
MAGGCTGYGRAGGLADMVDVGGGGRVQAGGRGEQACYEDAGE